MKLKIGNMKIKLFVKDDMFRHGLYTANPSPIARHSKYMEWDFNPPENDDIQIVYTDTSLKFAREKSKNNVAWLFESPEYHETYYEFIKNNHKLFKTVITHNKELLKIDKKFKFAPHAGSWLYDDDIKIYDKTKNFSIIASWKNQLSGHKLRHSIISSAGNKIDVYGNGYNKIEKKIIGLKDYRYTFCVENCKKDYYFTEKLIDCFLSGTIPIYWGCPSIGNFFNIKGIITFDTLHDLKDRLRICTEEYYKENMEAIIENYNKAHNYILAEDYIYENSKDLLYA